MTHIKKTTYAILALLLCSEFAGAGLIKSNAILLPKRFNITAHTGQDPVYRSLQNDNLTFIDSSVRSPFVKLIEEGEISVSKLTEFSNSFDWSSEHSSMREIEPSAHQRITNSEPTLYSIVGTTPIPAPPAFLLLFASITTCSRRRN